MQYRFKNLWFLAALATAMLVASAQAGWDPRAEPELEQEAAASVAAFKRKDPSLKAFFSKAAGWAVFPTIGKAGFLVGGAYGKGVVYHGGKVVGYAEMKQGSVGLQIGGQSYSEIIFFKGSKDIKRFKSEKTEFGAQASAVAADKGAGANHDYSGGVAIFTMIKGGLMAEASVGGQTFTYRAK